MHTIELAPLQRQVIQQQFAYVSVMRDFCIKAPAVAANTFCLSIDQANRFANLTVENLMTLLEIKEGALFSLPNSKTTKANSLDNILHAMETKNPVLLNLEFAHANAIQAG